MTRTTAVAILFFLGACAAPALRPNGLEQEARQALSGLVADFAANRHEDFIARFDRNSFSNFADFHERIRDFLLHNRQITIDPIVDIVLAEGAKVSLRFHWNRSFLDAAGNYKTDAGRCELVFNRRPSGGLVVTAANGALPF